MESQNDKLQHELLEMIEDLDSSRQAAMREQQEQRAEELLQHLEATDSKTQERLIEYDLLTQCRSKDHDTTRKAFNRLVQRYQHRVYTYIKYLVEDDKLAFMMTRDTFVQAYRNIAFLQPGESLVVYLLKIARKQRLKALRHNEKGMLAFLPLPVYQWYLQRRETDEPSEETSFPADRECRNVRRQLSAYSDNALPSVEASRVETHLAACPECCQIYDTLLERAKMVRTFGKFKVPGHLRPAINEILDRESVWERLWGGTRAIFAPLPGARIRQVAAALSLVLIILGTFSVYQQRQLYDQQTQIRTLERRVRKTVRESNAGQPARPLKDTYVILTGALVSEVLPLELGEYIPDIIADPERTQTIPETKDFSRIGTDLENFLQAIQAEITEDSVDRKGGFLIHTIIADLPASATDLLTLWFTSETTDIQPEQAKVTTMRITFHIIGKQEQ